MFMNTKIFNVDQLIRLDNKIYERLDNHPEQIRYRVILSDDDYDYIEDQELIDRLDKKETI